VELLKCVLTNVLGVLNAPPHLGNVVWQWEVFLLAFS
jgi:hypothetical protein